MLFCDDAHTEQLHAERVCLYDFHSLVTILLEDSLRSWVSKFCFAHGMKHVKKGRWRGADLETVLPHLDPAHEHSRWRARHACSVASDE